MEIFEGTASPHRAIGFAAACTEDSVVAIFRSHTARKRAAKLGKEIGEIVAAAYAYRRDDQYYVFRMRSKKLSKQRIDHVCQKMLGIYYKTYDVSNDLASRTDSWSLLVNAARYLGSSMAVAIQDNKNDHEAIEKASSAAKCATEAMEHLVLPSHSKNRLVLKLRAMYEEYNKRLNQNQDAKNILFDYARREALNIKNIVSDPGASESLPIETPRDVARMTLEAKIASADELIGLLETRAAQFEQEVNKILCCPVRIDSVLVKSNEEKPSFRQSVSMWDMVGMETSLETSEVNEYSPLVMYDKITRKANEIESLAKGKFELQHLKEEICVLRQWRDYLKEDLISQHYAAA